MHELSVMMEVIRIIEEMAENSEIHHVKEIALEIGEVSAVVPMFMTEYFPIVVSEKPLFKDAQLRFITIEARAICNSCSAPFRLVENKMHCPKCGSEDYTLFSGNEFSIREILVDEPEGE